MHPEDVRAAAEALRARGLSVAEVAVSLGLSRSTVRDWTRAPTLPRRGGCPRCSSSVPDSGAYLALLGYYLGDGHISRAPRYYSLRVSCDARYPAIIEDVAGVVASVRPGSTVFRVRAPGVVVVQAHWKHWPCLFPQHGAGKKHERPIVLEPWQVQAVRREPAGFLRGLFHSDGCRVRNWATRPVAGVAKRYEYPRWQFSNTSDDIRDLCCWALDLVDVAWRRSSTTTISVSTRAGVARLDELVGLKS